MFLFIPIAEIITTELVISAIKLSFLYYQKSLIRWVIPAFLMKKSMLTIQISLTVLLGIILLGYYTSPTITSASDRVSASEEIISAQQGQTLPIGAKAKMGGATIELEVAKTPQEQEIGLMYRTSLSKNRGMLFEFGQPRYTRFWMKNTLIPLDMIFLKDGIIKGIFLNVPPCKKDPCDSYGPAAEIDQVIELAGGRAKELNLKVGDRVAIEFLD